MPLSALYPRDSKESVERQGTGEAYQGSWRTGKLQVKASVETGSLLIPSRTPSGHCCHCCRVGQMGQSADPLL